MATEPVVTGPTLVTDPETLDAIYQLRARIWTESGAAHPDAFPDGRWTDDWDAVARHEAMWVDGELAASIRYTQWPAIHEMPNAEYFSHSCVDVQGPIGLPERLVVDPRHRRIGLYRTFADHLLHFARAQGATHVLMECTEPVAALLIKRGRRLVGEAPFDPRFPTTRFQWVLSDLGEVQGG